MASMLNDPEIADESEIYKAIKNDTIGIDEGDLNHLEGEEGEDVGGDEDEFGGDDDEMDHDDDNEIPEDYGHDED
jgi:hypothetical protein